MKSLEVTRRTIGEYTWEAMYQQRPQPRGGGHYFKRSQISAVSGEGFISVIPADVHTWVRGWDLAATPEDERGNAAFTAGVLIGKRRNGRYIIADVINKQLAADGVRTLIKHTAQLDREKYRSVLTSLPQDPGQSGKDQAAQYIKFLEAGFNYLMDLYKVVGASAELFWILGNPGTVFNLSPDLASNDEAVAAMEKSLDDFDNRLNRKLKTFGVDVKQLSPGSANPKSNVDILLQLISAAYETPTRILLGSEQGQLASSVDRDMFLSHIAGRQENFASDVILQPLIDRLMEYGYLPEIDTYSNQTPVQTSP